MKIYDYLFYKTYLLTQHSKNYEDAPVLGGLIFVIGCMMFNIFTIFSLLEAFGINTGIEFKKENKIIFCISLIAILYFYYVYNGRYKRIIKKFDQKKKGVKLHPIVVILLYYVLSFVLLLLVAMYKNHDGIFAE